jgi:hypothetical protein
VEVVGFIFIGPTLQLVRTLCHLQLAEASLLHGSQSGLEGESGTVTGKPCPRGLYGLFCEVCMAQQFFSCRKMTV